MTARQFYQIYRDARSFTDLFEIDLQKAFSINAKSRQEIFGQILRKIGSKIREFDVMSHQYKILLDNDIEIKIWNPNSYGKPFVQVSAKDIKTAEKTWKEIQQAVKNLLEG